MGKLLWKGKDPIGQCFRIGADTAPCREVVGIAEDMAFGDLEDDESMQMYVPATQSRPLARIIVRTPAIRGRSPSRCGARSSNCFPGMGYASVRPLDERARPGAFANGGLGRRCSRSSARSRCCWRRWASMR